MIVAVGCLRCLEVDRRLSFIYWGLVRGSVTWLGFVQGARASWYSSFFSFFFPIFAAPFRLTSSKVLFLFEENYLH